MSYNFSSYKLRYTEVPMIKYVVFPKRSSEL